MSAGSWCNITQIFYSYVYECVNYKVQGEGKATTLRAALFSRKKELPWVGFEPTTLCNLSERSTTHLVGIQYKTKANLKPLVLTQYNYAGADRGN